MMRTRRGEVQGRTRAARAGLAAGAGLSAAALAAPAAAQAADFTVTKLADTDGVCNSGVDCSLREAIAAASGSPLADDRILFQAGLTGTIALQNGELLIAEALEVVGPGAAALTVSGEGASRVFHAEPAAGVPVAISGLTVSGGDASYSGGGIYSRFAELTVRDSTISGNSASQHGGGVSSDQGTITIEGSTISGNVSDDRGGGVYSQFGTMTIEGSTISGNDAVLGGGVLSSQGTTTIESSTIAGNEATSDGGGILAFLSNPTLANTIVAANVAPTGPDLFGFAGAQFNASFSLIGSDADATINDTVAGSNITGQDPQLEALAANGGPTETVALSPTSPAVNKGSSFGATTDQRGLPRPVDYPGVPFSTAAGADGSDIGAFELQLPAPPPPPPPPVSNQFSFAGLKLNRRRGTATLFVRVPGPGRLVLRGPGVRRVVRTPPAARRVGLPIRARARALKRLRRGGRARVAARITYAPSGGSPRTKARSLRLVRKR